MKHADIMQEYVCGGWLGLLCPCFTPSAHLLLAQQALLALLHKAFKVFTGTVVDRNIILALHGGIYIYVLLNFKFAQTSIYVGMVSYAQPGQINSILTWI